MFSKEEIKRLEEVSKLPADKRQKIEQSLRRLAVDYHDVSLFNKKIIKKIIILWLLWFIWFIYFIPVKKK